MNSPTEKQNSESPPPMKGLGWVSLICGILTNIVLLSAGHIFIATHNAGMPFALIFFLILFGWTYAFIAICNREYALAILGIVFSFPSAILFFLYVGGVVVPFYIQWFKGG